MKQATQYPGGYFAPEKKPFPIFLVDDDETYLSALGFRLVKTNNEQAYKLYCFTSGEDCLRNLDLNPGIIVLDFYLNSSRPDAISGLEVIRQIKSTHPDIPVIILSGQKNMEVAVETLKAGAYTYLVKDKSALFSISKVINTLLNNRQAQAAAGGA